MSNIPNEYFNVDVINEYGVKINYAEAVNLMDEELMEEINNNYDVESYQEYFNIYCKEHEKKFGEVFEPAKSNPTM